MAARFRMVFTKPEARAFEGDAEAFVRALAVTAQQAAEEIQNRGRADIAAAGNFGTRWTDAFKTDVTFSGDVITIKATFRGPGWRKFQTGREMRGKPLLWIPLSFSNARGIRAKNFPGKLVRVDRAGGKPPLLISAIDHKPKYVGKDVIRIPKLFHLVEIVADVAESFGAIFHYNLNRERNG
jgi:hypothetical protein